MSNQFKEFMENLVKVEKSEKPKFIVVTAGDVVKPAGTNAPFLVVRNETANCMGVVSANSVYYGVPDDVHGVFKSDATTITLLTRDWELVKEE